VKAVEIFALLAWKQAYGYWLSSCLDTPNCVAINISSF